MNNIIIETLTPVHIGSGNILYHNTDFVQYNVIKKGKNFTNDKNDKTEESHIAVISEEKIWKLLGEQHLDNWLAAIAKRENLKDFLKRFAPEAKSKDYAKRRMPLYSTLNKNDTLKECIHNGLGLPYIPGSSIKGAIRTALLSSLANRIPDKEEKIEIQDRRGRTSIAATAIEQELFGSDPNSDVFRFIHVGDAYFQEETEIATRLISLNIRKSDENLQDTSKSQLVEAIGPDSKSEFQLKISNDYYEFVKRNYPQTGDMPISSISDLFALINEHTRRLVADEINYWREIEKTGGEIYIEEMQKILEVINSIKSGESCVLRIGHASGWRFITGAWTESLKNFKDTVIPASRPNFRTYIEYDFPKSRRLDEESYILGFIKLSNNGIPAVAQK